MLQMPHVISPHLDDAVLSLGQHLQTDEFKVVTIFAGSPEDDVCSDYDRSIGFSSSADAMEARRDEDRRAADVLDNQIEHLAFLDRQYRSEDQLSPDALSAIVRIFQTIFAEDVQVYMPLGIGHPDHRAVAQAAMLACPFRTRTGEERSILFYEELPYRVLNPEQVVEALDRLRAVGWYVSPVVDPIPHGPLYAKRAAIAAYRSQFPNGAEDPCLLVPERVWRCMPCA